MLRFTIFAAAALVVSSVAMVVVVRGFISSQAERASERNASTVAEGVLSRKLRRADFAAPVTLSRRRELDRLFARHVLVDGVDRATLFTRTGVVSYSTHPALIGWRTRDSGEARRALRSGATKTLVDPERVDGRERRALKHVMPMVIGRRAAGTVVSSRDYAPIARAVWVTFLPIATVLEVILLILFVSFVPLLRRATRQLGSHIDEIEHLALHDSLTGLPNRRLFAERIEQALSEVGRDGGQGAVVLLDLDRFKEINDTLGHAHGDELLRSFSARLRQSLRHGDTVARLGGDEFGIVMRIGDVSDVSETASRIHASLEPPFVIGDLELDVGASIGASLFPDDATDTETLVRFADIAMYTAKGLRSHIELYNSQNDSSSRDSLILRGQVRQAIDDGTLTAYFQPKVEVDSGLIVGAEALARWQHPTRGVILPDVFLPLVDKADQINTLTDRVLDLAVRQAAIWKSAGTPIGVAVNIEVSSLTDPSFPSSVARRLAEADVPGELLTLEITETSLMADPARARRVAEELAAIGVHLSIDDFGTGYSSLGYLTALPLSELKIDRSFIYRMGHSPNDMTIVRTILDLGARLALSVVAEGIETPAMRKLLSSLGCRLAQGYEFGSPMAAAELTKVLPSRLPARPALVSVPDDASPLPLVGTAAA